MDTAPRFKSPKAAHPHTTVFFTKEQISELSNGRNPKNNHGYPAIEIDSIALAYKQQHQEDASMLSLAKKSF